MKTQIESDLARLEDLLENERIDKAQAHLLDRHPSEIAYLANHVSMGFRHMLMPMIKASPSLVEIVYRLHPELVKDLLGMMQAPQVGRLFSEMESDDAVKILTNLPEELAHWVTSHVPAEDSGQFDLLMQYEEDQAGRIMTPYYFAIHEEATVYEAFGALRQSTDAESIYNIYVIDDRRHLVGVLSLRELLTHPNQVKVKEFMNEQVISVSDRADQEDAALTVERAGLSAVPVVNELNQLMGIITVDDVIHVIRTETTEDIMKLAGTTGGEYSLPSPMRGFLRRTPWLMVSFFGGMMTIQTNLFFASKVPHIELLAFVTIIAGMGGNIASQSSTIVVRGLATGKILTSELWQVLFRETVTGMMLGLFFGGLLAMVASFQFSEFAVIGFSVFTGMLISMLIAAVVGSMMPMIFEHFHVDPAVATGPFVSTTIDNLGLLGYFSSILLILKFAN
ncbi:MAG: magnesium transporter [Candidatus Lambdaproteobacteria bacterium RIFOXYD2_FULL_50_16]|uniref:Magnesium transporter MgtE n=1 Tax=Candidatus Lambdaproteobacteria bacterium RIFOXYD2_FULL_50_16 TaxID=1817772 RepID=A0A1F6G941_9PROT|nr:MAG: magnesium transporter [Candidatus Lambdaproteobacteria bacterium RIFOXYD2_FULL_50_16]